MSKVIQLDPTNHFMQKADEQGMDLEEFKESLFQALGLLPQFVVESLLRQDLPFREAIARAYGFPMDDFGGAKVNKETGEYNYPEDPTQWPLAKFNHPSGDIAYFYEHAMISFFTKDSDVPYNSRID